MSSRLGDIVEPGAVAWFNRAAVRVTLFRSRRGDHVSPKRKRGFRFPSLALRASMPTLLPAIERGQRRKPQVRAPAVTAPAALSARRSYQQPAHRAPKHRRRQSHACRSPDSVAFRFAKADKAVARQSRLSLHSPGSPQAAKGGSINPPRAPASPMCSDQPFHPLPVLGQVGDIDDDPDEVVCS